MKIFLPLIFLSASAWGQDSANFKKLLADILEKDPAFKEVELQTPYFESQVKQGFSRLFLPEVSLHYGHYEQHNNQTITKAGEEYRLGGLNAAFNLFSFGADLNNYRAVRLERKAQKQRVLTQLLSREQELGLLVLDYLKEAKNVEILKRLLELRNEALKVSRRRFERGSLSEQDYSKVKLDVSNAKAELLVAEQSVNTLVARIRAFGVTVLPKAWPWEQELTHKKIEDLKAMSSLVTDLPQFQEAALEEEAAQRRYQALKGSMLGSVQLNFSRSYYQFLEQDQWEWRTSLVYTLPLFDQFDQYTEYKRTEAQRLARAVRRTFQERFSDNNQDAEGANLEISWKNWVERKDSLSLSSRLYSSSLFQFNQGQLSVNELFVDQDRLLRTEQTANLALHQLHTSVLSFCHSRGRAFVLGCF